MTQELYATYLGLFGGHHHKGVKMRGGGGATLHAQVEISAMFTEDEAGGGGGGGGFKLRSVQK